MIKLNDQEKQYLLNDLVEYRERAIELLGDENPKDKFNNIIEKHKFFNANNLNENQMYIDKNLIFKCFDVISFIFNKMHDEAYLFLNYNINSELIII